MMLRVCAIGVLFVSVIFWPFWLSVVLAILAMLYFDIFWEALPLFLLSDLLFGVISSPLSYYVFVAFLGSAAALFIIETSKKKLKFYPTRR